MTPYEQSKALFAKRIAHALPISLDFGRSEYLSRVHDQAEKTAKLQREIEAIRKQAQQAAMRLYLLMRDNAPSAHQPSDDLLLENAQ